MTQPARPTTEELRQRVRLAREAAAVINTVSQTTEEAAEALRTAEILELAFRPRTIERRRDARSGPRQLQEAIERAVEEAQQPKPEPEPPPTPFQIDWYSTEVWTAPTGTYRIIEMQDQHLWETLIWCYRNIEPLYLTYGPQSGNLVSLMARRWLAAQSAFRAMLQEGLRRQLTFPKDIHDYVSQYVLGRDGELADYRPWNDPRVRELQADMQEFLSQPVVVDDGYGKERRIIDID